jgi:DNA invertase Pin-like site-specific DNA recombinase
MSEKVRSEHLARKAVLYVRQSSQYQVMHNVESQKLQYAMKARLEQLGWHEIEVVDEDLGRSAAGTVTRSGFERMVAEVCLGRVGAVAAREVSRFARNSREWQQLVEVCRVVDTLLIDQETVYAPRQSNDRLLLGLKGSLNEYELDLLRQRSLEARREMAKRGELIVAAPVGFVKTEDHSLEKAPDRRVQQAIHLAYEKFTELGSVRQTLLWFLEHGLRFPVHDARGELSWKRPSYASIYRVLTNPAYGGAYAYGKSEHTTVYEDGVERQSHRRKPRERWFSLIPNAHEGYVEWARFEQVQQAIAANGLGADRPGAVRTGPAMLAGLLRCRRCGHKLTVRYTGSRHDMLRYSCWRGFLDNGDPRCIAFGGRSMDEAIGREVLRVVQPAAIEAAILASEAEADQHDQVAAALQRDLEAARYQAQRAHKQYDAADPENRLVVDELERRWNIALKHVQALEERLEQHRRRDSEITPPSRDDFMTLADDLEALWCRSDTDVALKKRVIRTLIREVVVDVDAEASEVVLLIHWKGGAHTELRLPRRRRGQNARQASPELIDAVRILARTCTDDVIAGVLNRNGLRTGRGNRFSRERVASLRNYQSIPCFCAERARAEGWTNLTGAAAILGISPRTLRLAIDRGEVEAEHPLPEGPWVINHDALRTAGAIDVVQRARQARNTPAIPSAKQPSLDLSVT